MASANADWGGGAVTTQRPRLAVSMLGRLSIRLDDRELVLANRKSRALIGYLALSDRGEEARERLVGLLWSDSDEERARASLRTTLHGIRSAFHAGGFDGLRTDKLKIALERTALDVDLWHVLDEARAGRAHPSVIERDRLLESLMQDLEAIDPAFRVWLLAKRQSLQERLVRDLEEAMRASPGGAGQESIARGIMSLDPTHEEAARVLMRARISAADVGGALGIYKKLWDLLVEDYDTEPSKETQDLVAQIKLGALETTPAPSTARPMSQPVARRARLILSLGAFSASAIREDQRYLVHEFRRELAASLVRFREWMVRDLPAGEMGAGPGHGGADEFVLDGGSYQTESGARLTLTLREPSSGAYLWSEMLALSPATWLSAQQSVVRRIATALNVHISAGRMAQIARRSESDLLAYDLWLRGQATMRSFDAAGWHKAAEIFRNLIEQMPGFAPGYSSLAQLHSSIHVSHHGLLRDKHRAAEALACAREAVRLDPVDSRAQLSLGWAHLMANQHEQATAHFELARELNENDPWTLVSSALGYAFSGEHELAADLADQALKLCIEPSPAHWGYYSRILFLGGNYDAAAEAAKRAADVPALPGWKVATLYVLGRQQEASAELARFFQISSARWCGRNEWSREGAIRWFLQSFPIKLAADWERLRDGLCGAGAPGADLKFGFWDEA
jgi:DNA-binding SARP family transcriptional activator